MTRRNSPLTTLRRPAKAPCGSCPYRQDVPSGVWDESEYRKLPEFDNETALQPSSVFLCHQQDGRLCAGWVAVHDMKESLGLRLAVATGQIDPADIDTIIDYTTTVPLFASGTEAAEHGLEEVEEPSLQAIKQISRLDLKQQARTGKRGS